METMVTVAAIAFCIGGLVGAVISRSLGSPDKQKELEKSLAETRRELDSYHQDVAQHFAQTSRLVNNLTESYKEVHEHLAKGAIQLTNPEISKQILAAGDGKLGIEAHDVIDDQAFQPPRDWAPKMPGSKGTLSEEYGLNDEQEEEEAIKSVAEKHREAS